LGIESEFTDNRHEAVIDPPAKCANAKVAGIVIQKDSANTSGVVALPSGHDNVGLKIRPIK
jgi:hypothetical protein